MNLLFCHYILYLMAIGRSYSAPTKYKISNEKQTRMPAKTVKNFDWTTAPAQVVLVIYKRIALS